MHHRQQTSELKYPQHLLIAINKNGVLLLDPKTKVSTHSPDSHNTRRLFSDFSAFKIYPHNKANYIEINTRKKEKSLTVYKMSRGQA